MTALTAWQHIYSNVEKKQSPHRRGGFQTLFYSKAGLSEAEIEEIEARLLYFPSQGEPVKRVFFHTSTGKSVLAQAVPLPEADQAGRGGRYLAHGLVFAPEASAFVAANIFGIFQTMPFVTTIDEALRQGDMATGDIAPATVLLTEDARRYQVEEAQRWRPEDMRRLALLALRAEALRQEGRSVVILGSPEEAFRTLAAAFLAVPPVAAPSCSFDTYFHKCNPVALYYWAVGLQASPADSRFIEVDAPSRRVLGQAPEAPATSYERWTLAMLASGRLAAIVEHKPLAFALCEWLEGRSPTPPAVAPDEQELVVEILRANEPKVAARFRGHLARRLSPRLAERIFPRLYAQRPSLDLLERIRQGFDLLGLLDELYAAYAAERFRAPGQAELQELFQTLTRVEHRGLFFLVACWFRDSDRVWKALSQTDEAAYPRFVEAAIQAGTADPDALLVPGRAHAFLDAYCRTVPPHSIDLASLAQALLRHGECSALPRLASLVPGGPRKDLRKLAEALRGQVGEAESLRRAVDEELARLSPPSGILCPLRRLFRRAPDATDRNRPRKPGPQHPR